MHQVHHCYQWLAGGMSTPHIPGCFHVFSYIFLCSMCVRVCLWVRVVIGEWENYISLWEIIIYQVRLPISLELLSRSRTAECPGMRFFIDGCHSLSRAWWMFSHLAKLIDWANWIQIPYSPVTWWRAEPIPILASELCIADLFFQMLLESHHYFSGPFH